MHFKVIYPLFGDLCFFLYVDQLLFHCKNDSVYYMPFLLALLKDLQERSRSPLTSQNPLLTEASLLTLPVVVSLINLLLPGLFNLAAWMEEYESPSVCTYVAISRLAV